jgi:diguanylate cyclase (GGDEF)-like protein
MGVSGSGLALARISEEGGAMPALDMQPLGMGNTANVSRLGDLVLISTPDGVQRWDGERAVPDSLDGLDELRQTSEILMFEQASDGARWAISYANVYAQPPGGRWSLVFSAAPGDGPLTVLELLDDGRALVGGNGQLLLGSLPQVRSAGTTVAPRLTSVMLEPDQGSPRMLNLDEPAVLDGWAGVLRFQVGYPNFATGARPQYRFRLLGLGEGWSEWSGLSSFTVAALDAGNYELQYQARRQRGQHQEGVSFLVTVVPRWYERRGLQILASALLALLAGLVFSRRYRRRAKRLTRQNIELDQLVRQRTFDLEQANVRLRDLAERDGLTGVANRRLFDQHLAKAIRHSHADASELCLLLCDVDHFKEFNDSRGHLAGDEMLVCIAQVLVGHVRGDTLVARYGGEEFALVAQRCSMDAALQMAERLRAAVESGCGGTTISIGVAQFGPNTTQSGQSLIERADAALYQAKHLGRNRVERG